MTKVRKESMLRSKTFLAVGSSSGFQMSLRLSVWPRCGVKGNARAFASSQVMMGHSHDRRKKDGRWRRAPASSRGKQTIMKIMGRVVFQNMRGAEAAEERLRAAGYETDICWDVLCPIDSSIWMEVFKDFAVDANTKWEAVSGAVMDDVQRIVDSHGGDCMEAGAVPD